MLTVYQLRLPKTLNFIRRNVYCCAPDTKATAYISVVRPHLEYAAAAWDPYLVADCKLLEKMQRRAARFVSERELTFTFAICCRPSVCLSSVVGNARAPYSGGSNFP